MCQVLCLRSLQYAEMQQSAGKYGDDLKSTKADIADMNRKMMRLQSEIDMVKAQVKHNNLNVFEGPKSSCPLHDLI